MKKLKFIVEKNKDGYGAFREETGNSLIATTGENLAELKSNIVKAYNLYLSEGNKNKITADQVILNFDLPSFFDLYKEVNAAGLGKRIGMHKSLISDYVNGKRKPSQKQIQKILTAIKELGREFSELEIA